jgi:hypothetical protein
MAVVVAMQNPGNPKGRAEIAAVIEHMLSDRPGEWRVSIVSSRENDDWEVKLEGPNGFERTYALIGSAGEHEPEVIGFICQGLAKMVCE